MNLTKQSLAYLDYRLRSQTRFNIHSPFVFELVTKVINDKKNYLCYAKIEKLRRQLLADERAISVLDLGAGGKTGANDIRKIKTICRKAEKNRKYGQLLFRLVQHFRPETILELGTSLGITTMYLSEGNPKAKVITVEGCPQTLAAAQENFSRYGARNIETVNGNFDVVLAGIAQQNDPLGLVFFDGNHRKAPTLEYFNTCLRHSHNNSVFIFDDINWSEEMQEAWKEIKRHPSVTACVDLFFLGIVFFRKELSKEEFLIRF